jgi:hypothetical protein
MRGLWGRAARVTITPAWASRLTKCARRQQKTPACKDHSLLPRYRQELKRAAIDPHPRLKLGTSMRLRLPGQHSNACADIGDHVPGLRSWLSSTPRKHCRRSRTRPRWAHVLPLSTQATIDAVWTYDHQPTSIRVRAGRFCPTRSPTPVTATDRGGSPRAASGVTSGCRRVEP